MVYIYMESRSNIDDYIMHFSSTDDMIYKKQTILVKIIITKIIFILEMCKINLNNLSKTS